METNLSENSDYNSNMEENKNDNIQIEDMGKFEIALSSGAVEIKNINQRDTFSKRLPKSLGNALVNSASAPLSYQTLKKASSPICAKCSNPLVSETEVLLQPKSLLKKNNANEFKNSSNSPELIYNSDDIQRSSSQLIDEHLQEIQVRIHGHSQAAMRYEKRDRIIGYPVTLLSSFVASTLMLNLSQDIKSVNQVVVDIVGFSLSVISFVLSLSRDYLKYTTQFQAHDISSKLYTNLLRSIEVRLIGNNITIDDKRDMFKDIIDQMSIIEQYELPIPSDINKSIRAEIFLPRSVVINNTLNNEFNV